MSTLNFALKQCNKFAVMEMSFLLFIGFASRAKQGQPSSKSTKNRKRKKKSREKYNGIVLRKGVRSSTSLQLAFSQIGIRKLQPQNKHT